MSKSKGNVISAIETLNKYNDTAVRFYFLRDGPLERDEHFNSTQLVDSYNAHIVNEFANSLRRVSSLRFLPSSQKDFVIPAPSKSREKEFIASFNKKAGIMS